MSSWKRKIFFRGAMSKTGQSLKSRPDVTEKVPMLQHFCSGRRKRRSGKAPWNIMLVEASMRKGSKTGLGCKEFRPTFDIALSDNCLQKRQDALATFLEVFTKTPKNFHVIFADECVTYRT
jgi:hypothetical protein